MSWRRKSTESWYCSGRLALVPGVGIMILVGVVACAAPMLRALRVAPVEALKVEGQPPAEAGSSDPAIE